MTDAVQIALDSFKAAGFTGVDVPVLMPLPWGGDRRQVITATMEAAASA